MDLCQIGIGLTFQICAPHCGAPIRLQRVHAGADAGRLGRGDRRGFGCRSRGRDRVSLGQILARRLAPTQAVDRRIAGNRYQLSHRAKPVGRISVRPFPNLNERVLQRVFCRCPIV